MFTKYSSMNSIRRLRIPSRRTRTKPFKEGSEDDTVLPLSESDLQELKLRDRQMEFPEFALEPRSDYPVIDKTIHTQEVEPQRPLIKEKKKSTFIKLKDLALKHPLAEAPTVENQFERLAEAVTPLYKIPYHKQLKIKQRYSEDILRELRMKMKEVKAPLVTLQGRLPCPLENIIPAPELIGYRNKDEFSVHVGVDGNPKTVGYFIGLPIDPNMRCIPPTPLVNIKDSHKLVAKHFQTFIRESPYNTCFKFNEGGVWRNIIVRSNLKEELMAVVTIYPVELSLEAKEELKQSLHHYFFRGPGAECGLASLYLQACPHAKCPREVAPFELIEGQSHLVEECLDRKFRISPDSFFQTNTRAAEFLYNSIKKVAEVSTLTTLLDVCCGTGTISIFLAPYCRGAIGIDAISSAIEDAKINAKNNNVHNASYIYGKVETFLPILTRDLEDSAEVIAVVNPARSGLHPSVIESIRQCESIKKLIFVTCKPEGNAMMNMAMLGSTVKSTRWKRGRKITDQPPKKDGGRFCDPFILRYAIPIDLFPHTLHVEYVFLFERVSEF